MIHGAILDMDGLMLDTERLTFENWLEAMTRRGYTYSEEIYKNTIGLRRAETEQFMKSVYGSDFPFIDLASECHDLFVEKTEKYGIPVKKGLPGLLDLLKEKGVKTAVATSTRRVSAERALKMAGVFSRFDAVVTAEDVSKGKPDPEIFLKAAERIGVDACACAAFEDSLSGIRSAFGAGMTTVMVPDMIEPTPEILPMVTYLCSDLNQAARCLFPE